MAFGAWRVDEAIVGETLRALEPLALEAAVEAERMQLEEQVERRRIAELELEQAHYEALLAERRYAACDPDNRLIAAQLESSWEEALRRVQSCERKLNTSPTRPVPLPTTDLEGLAGDLETAWNAPGATMQTRQRLVRVLIEDIVVDIDEETDEIVLAIHWKGGQHSEVRVRKLRTGEHRRRTSDEALAVVRRMAGRWPDDQIAASLNRMGFRTGQDKSWTARRVKALCRTHEIHAHHSADTGDEWLTMTEAARKLGVTNHAIRRLIRDGDLPAQQAVPRAPYQIQASDLRCERVTAALARRGGPGRKQAPLQPSLFSDT
jgi:excisionase family DNA binding protein